MNAQKAEQIRLQIQAAAEKILAEHGLKTIRCYAKYGDSTFNFYLETKIPGALSPQANYDLRFLESKMNVKIDETRSVPVPGRPGVTMKIFDVKPRSQFNSSQHWIIEWSDGSKRVAPNDYVVANFKV